MLLLVRTRGGDQSLTCVSEHSFRTMSLERVSLVCPGLIQHPILIRNPLGSLLAGARTSFGSKGVSRTPPTSCETSGSAGNSPRAHYCTRGLAILHSRGRVPALSDL